MRVVETNPVQEQVDNGRLKDVSQRYPVEEAKECLQGRLNERSLLRLLKNLRAQLENFRELATHLVLQVLDLGLSHLLSRVVEDFFRQKPEDDHVVLAQRQVRL